jgi:hypothetical protein
MPRRPTKSPDLTPLLARAREVAPKLGSAADELNAALARAEEALASLRLGVTASVDLEEDGGSGSDWFELLTFGKQGAAWKLLIETGEGGFPETFSTSPLLNASREKRLLAAERLPRLVEELVKEAEEQIAHVRARAEAVDTLVTSISSVRATK